MKLSSLCYPVIIILLTFGYATADSSELAEICKDSKLMHYLSIVANKDDMKRLVENCVGNSHLNADSLRTLEHEKDLCFETAKSEPKKCRTKFKSSKVEKQRRKSERFKYPKTSKKDRQKAKDFYKHPQDEINCLLKNKKEASKHLKSNEKEEKQREKNKKHLYDKSGSDKEKIVWKDKSDNLRSNDNDDKENSRNILRNRDSYRKVEKCTEPTNLEDTKLESHKRKKMLKSEKKVYVEEDISSNVEGNHNAIKTEEVVVDFQFQTSVQENKTGTLHRENLAEDVKIHGKRKILGEEEHKQAILEKMMKTRTEGKNEQTGTEEISEEKNLDRSQTQMSTVSSTETGHALKKKLKSNKTYLSPYRYYISIPLILFALFIVYTIVPLRYKRTKCEILSKQIIKARSLYPTFGFLDLHLMS
ncbi:hypothetical protein QYM36_004651 [Artemia franciscana]|uniref:Uncharacterized protein n=1 Tax=Artemia franciscana TaxID=6661 RepID=A0AA88IAY1_ARTSF|nr:hypothetical protein QYM36_004651 [Artemia franciscana]